jgi:predicted O-methyltransferase YrrM
MLPGEKRARKFARQLRGRVPGAFAAIDVALPRRRPPWGGPMNGQIGRHAIVRSLIGLRPPSVIVETGTYLGVTAEFLALLTGVDVWTCESQAIYFKSARKRFRANPLVHAVLAESPHFLKSLADDASVPKENALFYLDAHWDANLPLREELSIINESWQKAWILIDDFQVPGDEGYGYDDYGSGAALVLEYLDPELRQTALVPTLPSQDETGARRGCVLLAPPEDIPMLVGTGLLASASRGNARAR